MSARGRPGFSSAVPLGLQDPENAINYAYDAMKEAHDDLKTERRDMIQVKMEIAVERALRNSGNASACFVIEVTGNEIRLEMLGECRILRRHPTHQELSTASQNSAVSKHHNHTSVATVSGRYEPARVSRQAGNQSEESNLFVPLLMSLGASTSGQSLSRTERDTMRVWSGENGSEEEPERNRRRVDVRRYERENQDAPGRTRITENGRVMAEGTNRMPSDTPPSEGSPKRGSRDSTGDIVLAFEAGANWNCWRSSDSRPTEEQAERDHYMKSSAIWMKQLQERTHPLLDENFRHNDTRIKIAILDTGIDRYNMDLAEDANIKERRAFGSSSTEDSHDTIGHGTHLAGLLRKVSPHAHIFVAKVTKSRGTEGKEGERVVLIDDIDYADVAAAITYAVETWEVDIITMSFGRKQSHRDVRTALLLAASRNVLVFAAAGNVGHNQPVDFPASDSNAITIFSCDGVGKLPVPDTNPAPTDGGTRYFTLGEGVESYWPHALNGRDHRSGTSIATPIAAATAALVLEFANQIKDILEVDPDYPSIQDSIWWLKTQDGMRAVFRDLMSATVKDRTQADSRSWLSWLTSQSAIELSSNYRYVIPWALLDAGKSGMFKADAHKSAAFRLVELLKRETT